MSTDLQGARPYLNWIINKCVIQPGGWTLCCSRTQDVSVRRNLATVSVDVLLTYWPFRPPWMVMAGEKSGVCEPRVFPKIVIILVHKSFSNLLKFWVPHFQANPFDPRAHVTHNGWSPFYTCLLGYLIRTHGILCSEHHRKKYNEPGLNTCLGWWGNDPATQKIIRAVAEVYQHYRSYTSQRILAFAYQDPPRKQQWCWYKNKFGLIPPKVNEWWFSS